MAILKGFPPANTCGVKPFIKVKDDPWHVIDPTLVQRWIDAVEEVVGKEEFAKSGKLRELRELRKGFKQRHYAVLGRSRWRRAMLRFLH